MNKYVVISPFKDEKDNGYVYDVVGKQYPRDGINIDEERIQELLTDKNKTGHPLIKQVEKEQSVSYEEGKKENPEANSGETELKDPETNSGETEPENPEVNSGETEPENPEANSGETEPENPEVNSGETEPENPETNSGKNNSKKSKK